MLNKKQDASSISPDFHYSTSALNMESHLLPFKEKLMPHYKLLHTVSPCHSPQNPDKVLEK